MNTSEVLTMIETLKETGFKHIDVSHEGSHILLSNSDFAGANLQASPAMASQGASVQVAPAAPVATSAPSPSVSEKTATEEEAKKPAVIGGHLVESPIVGTFYAASGPDAEDFVQVGSKVSKGDVLCIIEAMKLMNEIEADKDGEIAEILVANEDGVEYGQPLFRIV